MDFPLVIMSFRRMVILGFIINLYVLTNQGPAKALGWKNDTWIFTNLEATHYLAIDQPFLSKFYDSFAEFKHDFPEYFI